MEFQFETLRVTRANVLNLLNAHSLEQLNQIPEGFSNNLIWNAGHLVVTQQLLVFGLAGLPLMVPGETVAAFRKGSQPVGDVSQEAVDQIKEWLISTPEMMANAYQDDLSQVDFKHYPTSFGIELTSVNEAITFNNVHEGIHLGIMMELRKLV